MKPDPNYSESREWFLRSTSEYNVDLYAWLIDRCTNSDCPLKGCNACQYDREPLRG